MISSFETLVTDLAASAAATDQRRLLVLAGDREAGWDAAFDAVDVADIDDSLVTAVTTREGRRFERVSPARAERLLGETRRAVVCDAHEGFTPNVLGRIVGAVDGGGFLVLLTPPLEAWATDPSDVDERLAVPPYSVSDVTSRFRRRLVDTLSDHPGVAIVDVDAGVVQRDGTTDTPPGGRSGTVPVPDGHRFPRATYEACLTPDQARAVATLERLGAAAPLDGFETGEDGTGESPETATAVTPTAVVVEADRGRGKSSAAGLAGAALVDAGADVLVTAPRYRNAREVFVRASALLGELGYEVTHDEASHRLTVERGDHGDGGEHGDGGDDGVGVGENVDVGGGGGGSGGEDRASDDGVEPGRLFFRRPPAAQEAVEDGDADVLLVDEAAALPVRVLEGFLDAPAVAFFTTVHGYEGAGRGFSVRFRDHLSTRDHEVVDVRLDDPIRYSRGDPVESWAFRALLLDARPPVEEAIAEATPDAVAYEPISKSSLAEDEHRLREVFGLLVLAHYRTEPDDLARLLDAPNLSVRALTYRGHVVSVALLAREGGLDEATRRRIYEGSRIRGHMLPDVLTSQLRDERAAEPVGLRVMRIATHHAVRSRGLGSLLLSEIHAEFEGELDWLGVGFGATPELLRFWRENGFRSVYLSTSRNESSGEHSAVMLDPLSASGAELADRHTEWFLDRAAAVLSDPLSELDPDVAREALRAGGAFSPPALTEREWRLVVDASAGPGLYSADPRPFRRLAVRALADTGPDAPDLSERAERLLVRKVLQSQAWSDVADELGYVSTGQCMKALGEAYRPLVEAYGNDAARAHRRRYGAADGGSTEHG